MPQSQEEPLKSSLPWLYHSVMARALQSAAWTAYNQGFHSDDSLPFREVGSKLYQRVTEERIRALYAKSDEQNRLIERKLHTGAGGSGR